MVVPVTDVVVVLPCAVVDVEPGAVAVVVVPWTVVDVLPCAVVEVLVVGVRVVVEELLADVVVVAAHPACRMMTLQLGWRRPAFTAALQTCAAQLTYAP
jgi:hypothetical protein